MEQLATLTQIPEPEPVMSKYSYAYDLDLSEVPEEHKEGVQCTFDTMYRTMAAIFENLVDECGVSLWQASRILPEGLAMLITETNEVCQDGQYTFEF